MADARPDRITAVRTWLAEHRLDGLLVFSLPNVRYLTGFSGSNALVLITAHDAVLLTDFRYQSQAAEEVGAVARVRIEPTSLWEGLWAVLRETSKVSLVGFESEHASHRDFQRLVGEGEAWSWRPVVDVIESQRQRKESSEVELIRGAIDMAERALDCTLKTIHAGMSEQQVAGVLERNLREAGSEGHPFPAIVATGERSALPHARAGSRAIAQGDFLLLDFGATCGGYCADITRTVVVGSASARQREVYEAVLGANELARQQVRAGLSGREADAIARGYLADRGLGDAFGHSLGHGLGLEVHEAPRLSRTAEALLPVGAVVTIEPGVYFPGWGGVRIEDDVYLGASGAEVLTQFRRDLIELG